MNWVQLLAKKMVTVLSCSGKSNVSQLANSFSSQSHIEIYLIFLHLSMDFGEYVTEFVGKLLSLFSNILFFFSFSFLCTVTL